MASLRPFPRVSPRPLGRHCLRLFSNTARPQSESRPSQHDHLMRLLGDRPTARSSGAPSGSAANRTDATLAALQSMVDPSSKRRHGLSDEERMRLSEEGNAISTQMWRQWKAGDIYAPHDLSTAEADKWKPRRRRPAKDVFDVLGINPLHEYKNFSVLAEFTTETGRIKHNKVTGLRPVNQRKIAKAVRRAIGMGLIPSVHKHPMLIRRDMERQGRRSM